MNSPLPPRLPRERSLRRQARIAGTYYLLLAVIATFVDSYLPNRFFVKGDPAATARAITENLLTFRAWIVAEVGVNVIMLLVGLSLYSLLRDVDRRHARFMLALVVIGVTISIVNLLAPSMAVVLIAQASALPALSQEQRDTVVYALWQARGFGVQLAFIFWGLWLFPFGILVQRSGFMPRWLGTLLIVGGVAYVALSIIGMTLPEVFPRVLPVLIPFFLAGELSAIVYLLWKGVRSTAMPLPAAS